MEREVLQAARMGHSGWFSLDQLPAWAASGYTLNTEGRLVENIYALGGDQPEPSLFASAPDLVRLWQLLASGELLPREEVEQLLAPYWDPQLSMYRIEGRAPGAQVVFGGTLNEPLAVVVLSNSEEGAGSVFEQLAAWGKVSEVRGSLVGQ